MTVLSAFGGLLNAYNAIKAILLLNWMFWTSISGEHSRVVNTDLYTPVMLSRWKSRFKITYDEDIWSNIQMVRLIWISYPSHEKKKKRLSYVLGLLIGMPIILN